MQAVRTAERVSYIVGSTGAGDSFCAGVTYELSKGWNPEKTLRFASAPEP
jgi:sugar/nucleoside kinase (ribokinase family)